MTAPDFLVIGHVVKDAREDTWRLGGTVTYAATQASRLGLRAGAITRASDNVDLNEYLPDVCVHRTLSRETTTFENRYEKGIRVQHVWARASRIEPEDVPLEWQGARIVLLGPVLDEVAPGLAKVFPEALVGFCAQGGLRNVRRDGLVVRRRGEAGESVRGVGVVVVSDEDMEDDGDTFEQWQSEAPIVVVTEGRGGARVYSEGRERRIGAFPHKEVDPTGAGDVFATAFLIALYETKSVASAARFAAAAAGLSIEAEGTAKVGTRREIERALAEHPEVVLK
jgi:1D-myo-inositol 3-kinase